MPLPFPPQRGTIVLCDFNGFIEPEMVKKRPVIILSPALKNRPNICTVVPLSTVEPYPIMPYHARLELDPPLPTPYNDQFCWVKGDMLYTLDICRMTLPRYKDAQMNRQYDKRILSKEQMKIVENCVLAGIGINNR